ncbi:hypothetical protein L2Y94_10280 [Luteibacter aegosomatis]|uniref:hypothetical protein n=1 Tax=Luteibacter aegosomatis TaxID=2911537 RepID=UPI001FF9B2FE|nr:hypothetical protein [Luteibacter aegosomatis]UPG87716.1 hypothetical protein L2Y94_10280 [Luteibacter aegosomatis]
MRALLFSVATAIGLFSVTGIVAAEDCPLTLSLNMPPDAFVAKLGAMPSFQSRRPKERGPIDERCDYETSTFTQFATSPGGLCTIAGQPVALSMVDILDSKSTVVSHVVGLPRSDASLEALRSALGKIASPVTPEADFDAWQSKAFNVTDAVYARGDDVWVVSHEQRDPGSTNRAPESYVLFHVRRPWLDFARRDLNRCAKIPEP